MKRRRTVSVFGMSFLDVMFCGFGSVILLVMIVNSHAVTKREELYENLRGEVTRLEREVQVGEQYLVELHSNMNEVERERVLAQDRSRQVVADIEQTRLEVAALERETLARAERINRLEVDLKSLDSDSKRLEDELDREEKQGEHVRKFRGDGDRQYLTGLKMGGKRTLVLVDVSASMLDSTVVNVVRLRNLPPDTRRAAAKWRQVLATVDWIASQLPVDGKFQIYTFNTLAKPVLDGTSGTWLEAKDRKRLDDAIEALHELAPEGGTSLHHAFVAIGTLDPPPDNVVLLTDGLPTQGASKPLGTKVSGKQRLKHFQQAVRHVPSRVPINIILFPMEGDPFAASEFWKLAMATRGSLISPAKDWP